MKLPFSLALAVALFSSFGAMAELSLPSFFSDHMVLQRNDHATIWGKADPGTLVTVHFKGLTATAKANKEGKWGTRIKIGKADSKGSDILITAGDDKHTIKDVLVGEVWFASGQSNMVVSMNRLPDYADIVAAANYPGIRMFNAPTVTAIEPQYDIAGQWEITTPKSCFGYSAVAFFFAKKLHEELGIPIGVIKSAWGGKPVETFTSREALMTLPGTRDWVEATVAKDKVYDHEKALAAHEKKLEQWKENVAAWKAKPADKRGRSPRKPATPKRPLDTEGEPGVLFNSMINPFIGYTIQGAIWYQGEGNAKEGRVPYDQTLPLLINDWRTRWNRQFDFIFVQLANFRAPTTEPGIADWWALLQDRQRLILDTTPKTGMAIINDIGEEKDIHPKNKKDVGYRLAYWALAKTYDKDIVHSGPLYKDFKKTGNSIEVTFNAVGSGLKSRDGKKLQRFEIAGNDKKWHWADAEIVGKDTVRVSSPEVKKPVAVRYAWASNPTGANLVNSEGLPTSIFRTDDWNDVIPGKTVAAKELSERQQLAAQIRDIKAKREKVDRKSDDYKKLSTEMRALMEKFKATAPKK